MVNDVLHRIVATYVAYVWRVPNSRFKCVCRLFGAMAR